MLCNVKNVCTYVWGILGISICFLVIDYIFHLLGHPNIALICSPVVISGITVLLGLNAAQNGLVPDD